MPEEGIGSSEKGYCPVGSRKQTLWKSKCSSLLSHLSQPLSFIVVSVCVCTHVEARGQGWVCSIAFHLNCQDSISPTLELWFGSADKLVSSRDGLVFACPGWLLCVKKQWPSLHNNSGPHFLETKAKHFIFWPCRICHQPREEANMAGWPSDLASNKNPALFFSSPRLIFQRVTILSIIFVALSPPQPPTCAGDPFPLPWYVGSVM